MMSSTKQQQEWAEAKARRSLEAAERYERLKAMQQDEAEQIEAKTMQEQIEAKTMHLRALRMAQASSKPDR